MSPVLPPVPLSYSETHWSCFHPQWHLPSAVHDCGEICLTLWGYWIQWFPLIYICLTLWLTEPVSLSRPWRRTDTHFTGEMRWDGFDWLTDCHWVTGALLTPLHAAGEAKMCLWIEVGAKWCFCTDAHKGGACVYRWSDVQRLPVPPWVWWQLKSHPVKLATPTSSQTDRTE